MNESACQRAIKKLIEDNASILVSDLVQFGQQRSIEEVAVSVATAPFGFYWVFIQVTQKVSTSVSGIKNMANPPRQCEYSCTIHVIDSGVQSGLAGEEPYEMVHEQHRTLCDRIEALVCSSYFPSGGTYATYFANYPLCIPDPETSCIFRLKSSPTGDRMIRVQNADSRWPDPNSDQYVPIFYSMINFAMIEEQAR